MEAKPEFFRWKFLARGSLVAAVGRDEQVIREHIRRQKEKEKNFLDQSRLFEEPSLGGSSFVTHLGWQQIILNSFERF